VRDGKVAGVEFRRCVSVFDENRKFSPKFDDATTMTVDADFVITSVGQAMDWGNLLDGTKVELKPNKAAAADPTNTRRANGYLRGRRRIHGAALRDRRDRRGKEAAISIHRFVQPDRVSCSAESGGTTSRSIKRISISADTTRCRESAPRGMPRTARKNLSGTRAGR
jgi:hypothetical protein